MASTTSKSSQEVIDDFWKTYTTPANAPTKASSILPRNVYAQKVGKLVPKGRTETASVTKSYEEAKKLCEAKVAQIVKNCRRINQKYTDPYFDLEDRLNCITSLYAIPEDKGTPNDRDDVAVYDIMQDNNPAGMLSMFGMRQPTPSGPSPPSVKRVGDIFDDPKFYLDGVNMKDIRQGQDGDCWFLSTLAAMCNMEPANTLIEKVCVARDEEVGVYGFIFYRDGEWESVVIDDKLYLLRPDYEDCSEAERQKWEVNRVRITSEEDYRREFQSNSRSLYYAQSAHPDETWVPLIEKAFAKIHGDYSAIEGGFVGEGIEDLTGGVGTTIMSTNILSKDRFWADLLKVNEEFLFGAGTQEWDDPHNVGRDGIYGGHAYSILAAKTYKNERLLKVKNPWGQGEWNGPWSDGSSQWNAESIAALGHTFGDDGVFWIRFTDLLKKYDTIWRTRLFGPDWNVTQQWTSLSVPWSGDFQDTKFEVVLAKPSQTVIILSQLDDRYYCGFKGQYSVKLSFRLHEKGQEGYIMRTNGEFYGQRSVSVELDLEAGSYEVRLKLSAWRDSSAFKPEDVVKTNWLTRREKLLKIGLSYDLAHAKGQLKEPEEPEKNDAPTAVEKDTAPSDAKATTDELPLRPAQTALGSRPRTYGDAYGPSEDGYDADANADKDKPAEDAPKEDDKPKEDSWGAVCVVGLRVYCKEADATVEILRPKKEDVKKAILDVDNPAKDLAKETDVSKKEEVEEYAGEEKNVGEEKKAGEGTGQGKGADTDSKGV